MKHVTRGWRGAYGIPRPLVRIACIVAALFWAVFAQITAGTPTVYAQTHIDMSTEVGFNGFYAKDQWIPVALTIANNGPAVTAELQVYTADVIGNGDRYAEGTLRWSVHLRANGSTKVQIAVPGSLIEREAPVVCLVRGQAVATARLNGTALGSVSVVAVLSQKAQLERVFTGLTDGPGGPPVLGVSLHPSELPTSSNLLMSLRTIAVEPSVLGSGLTAAQRKALLTWVKLGGMLIVTGPGDVPGWAGYLPLRSGASKSVHGTALARFLGPSTTPPADFQAKLAPAAPFADVRIGTPKAPYVAVSHIGRGAILQTSFNPAQASLLAWPGDAVLWSQLFDLRGPNGKSALVNLLSPDSTLGLVSASDALSPLQIPSLSFWASLFMIYVVCVGPLAFLVLRRLKKEPYAWFVLPVLSVVTTGLIYWFGESQRPTGVLTEGVGVLDLVGDGTAETYGIRGFMSPQVMSGFVSTDSSMLLLPLAQHNVRELGVANATYGKTNTVSMDDVGRWGVRYVLASGAVDGQGELVADLESNKDTLTGTVTNNTRYTLDHVALCWNGNVYHIGTLKPGEIAIIGEQTSIQSAGDNYLSAYGDYNKDLVRGIGRSLGTLAAKENLIDAAQGQAVLLATTTDAVPSLPDLVTGQAISNHSTLVLVRQFVDVPTAGTVQSEVSRK